MSAAAALFVADVVPQLRTGVELAARMIDEGKALGVLERWVARSHGQRSL
jgi:anthranilate phosphoribosyltransferase